jgi:hypothetical protein
MRTNLRTGYLGTVTLAAFAAMLSYQPAAAGEASHSLFSTTVEATGPAVCHKVDEVQSALFPKMTVAAYDFSGADAKKLKGALDEVTERDAPAVTLVRLVLLPATNEALAFQFGMDGCHTVTLELNFEAMEGVFDQAGVDAPFGRTFYQLPALSI